MSQRGLAASTSQASCGHHADFHNIPTVRLGERLSSLRISEQQMPPRQGEPSGSDTSNAPIDIPGPSEAGLIGGDNAELRPTGSEDEPGGSQQPTTVSEDTTQVDSSPKSLPASTTPPTPLTISSGQSYSNENYDELTPLREALPPAVSTKRRSISHNEGGTVNRRNVNASSSYAALPSIDIPPRSTMNMDIGLSEILASPGYSPHYSGPAYDRTGSGSRGMKSPSGGDRQVDYFNLPILDRHGGTPYSPESSYRNSPTIDPPPPGSDTNAEGSTSTPSWSSSDVTSGTQSSSLRSPRIRNEGVLAPHGSFTSASGRQYQARAKLERAQSRLEQDNESVISGDSVSSWRSRTATQRSTSGSGRHLNENEYLQNVEAARGGDQLALYHLGWGPTAGPNRHSLGDSDLVWGSVAERSSPSSYSSRSSATSRPSLRSNSTSGSRRTTGRTDEERLRDALHRDPTQKDERPKPHARTSSTSDLFADVARMALRSNADNNKTPTPGATTSAPARPSMFKSASYISSTGSKKPKEKKERDRSRDENGIRERDPERETRRAARHAARKEEAAASASASGSNATAKSRPKSIVVSPTPTSAPATVSESGGQETPRPATRSTSPNK